MHSRQALFFGAMTLAYSTWGEISSESQGPPGPGRMQETERGACSHPATGKAMTAAEGLESGLVSPRSPVQAAPTMVELTGKVIEAEKPFLGKQTWG